MRALPAAVTHSLVHPRRVASTIYDALRQRIPVPDDVFDVLLPEELRRLSHVHWTPVAVALRAAELLAPARDVRVLDIGSGVGKMCCIGALTSGAVWHGIERDPRRVSAALKTARALGLDQQVRFTCGEMTRLDWTEFDSIYMFNPFETDLYGSNAEPAIAFSHYAESVRETQRRLSELRSGSRVVTYHGFGGAMPECFEMCVRENIGTDQLVLWVKRPDRSSWRAAA